MLLGLGNIGVDWPVLDNSKASALHNLCYEEQYLLPLEPYGMRSTEAEDWSDFGVDFLHEKATFIPLELPLDLAHVPQASDRELVTNILAEPREDHLIGTPPTQCAQSVTPAIWNGTDITIQTTPKDFFRDIPRPNFISISHREEYEMVQSKFDKSDTLARMTNSLALQIERSGDLPCDLPRAMDARSFSLKSDLKLESSFRLEDYQHVARLPLETYSAIGDVFKIVNSSLGLYVPFTSNRLPSLNECNAFMQGHFEYFHEVFPLPHQATFEVGPNHWLLVLAVIVSGMRVSDVLATTIDPSSKMERIASMEEFLRRAIQYAVSSPSQNKQ